MGIALHARLCLRRPSMSAQGGQLARQYSPNIDLVLQRHQALLATAYPVPVVWSSAGVANAAGARCGRYAVPTQPPASMLVLLDASPDAPWPLLASRTADAKIPRSFAAIQVD
ncbi:hypothetical protein OQA88_6062 [Cercophora sp. LCS_1]